MTDSDSLNSIAINPGNMPGWLTPMLTSGVVGGCYPQKTSQRWNNWDFHRLCDTSACVKGANDCKSFKMRCSFTPESISLISFFSWGCATNFDKVKGVGSKFITLNMFVWLVYFHTRKTATCANVTEATEWLTLRGLVVTAHICKSVVIIREIVLIVVLLAQGTSTPEFGCWNDSIKMSSLTTSHFISLDIFNQTHVDLSTKVKGGVRCYDCWCKSCLTISHCLVYVGKPWNGGWLLDCARKQTLIWKRSPSYISAVQICYHNEYHCFLGGATPELKWWMTASREISRTDVRLLQANWTSIKINMKDKYCLRTQTWLLSDLLLLISVWHFASVKIISLAKIERTVSWRSGCLPCICLVVQS